MNFLQTWMLWGLPLALLPVVIHLVNRMRHRTVRWAAMRFLQKASRSSTHMHKLRQWLILALRVLACLALIAALARPLFGGAWGLHFSGAPATVVLVLDRSASMQAPALGGGETRLQRVLRQAKESMAAFGGDTRLVLVDSATLRPREVPNAKLLDELPAAEPTDTGANLSAAMEAAVDYLADNPGGQSEIWLASDLQTTSWHPDDPAWAALGGRMKALPVVPRVKLLAASADAGSDASLSLIAFHTHAVPGSGGRKWAHEISFQVQGIQGETSLTLFDGANRHPVKINGPGRHRHRFETDALPAGQVAAGFVELPVDTQPANNRAHFAMGMPVAAKALVVGDTSAVGNQVLALAAAGDVDALVAPEIFRAGQLQDLGLLVWHGPEPEPLLRKAIDDFVTGGGVLVLMPQSQGKWGENISFGAAEVAPEKESFWRIAQWEHGEGPFADTDSGLPLSLDHLRVKQRVQFAFKGGSTPLALFNDGTVLAARQKRGAGMVVALATTPDGAWSNLGLGPVVVPAMRRLLAGGGMRFGAARYLTCGDDLKTAWPDAAKANQEWLLQSFKQASGLEQVRVPAADLSLHAGVYLQGGHALCLNRPLDEDDSATLSPELATGILGVVPIRAFEAKTAQEDGAMQTEIWRVALVLMLLLLTVEAGLLLPKQQAQAKDIKKGFNP